MGMSNPSGERARAAAGNPNAGATDADGRACTSVARDRDLSSSEACNDGSAAPGTVADAGREVPLEHDGDGIGNRRTVDQIIDEMGFGRYQVWLLCLCGAGWAADILDLQVVAYLIPALLNDWEGETRARLGLAASFTFAGMLLGSLFWGLISDRYGRRPAFMLTSLCAAICGMASASSRGLGDLLAWRLLQGFGLGGNLAVDFSLFIEFAPTNSRGASSTLLTLFATVGSLSAAALAWALVDPTSGAGWRTFLLASSSPGLLIAALRTRMLESPLYLASQGRLAEAEAVLLAVGSYNRRPLAPGLRIHHPAATAATAAPARVRACAADLMSVLQRLLARGAMSARMRAMSALWFALSFSFYGFSVWGPSYFLARGFTAQGSYQALFSSVACQIPGTLVAAVLVESAGRQRLLVVFAVGCCLSILGFTAAHSSPTLMLLCSLSLNFNTAALWAVTYTFTLEIFPTALRTSAMGVCSAVARVSGILASFLGGVFLAQSVALSLLAYALSYALVAVIAGACLRDVDMTGLPLSRLEGPQPKP